ncbi:HTH_Tnp_Tc3_2 domain-containing protein [Trichonephila clavipes]|uniref:HTH_Tnp_Tc3_2 domain-containing protein n=1 Tax=Trichonephila clavipes TaxID=2585209 RepID=A0A8X6WBQ3_TRICX|nr:HTH_Tnp_Tc3_2 domain-containing protein [Trichonephila clavipes]GFY32039.1 HTH_Tnp_Tc3_2 domain-containing protein [Trichonephila clavipes]GFY32047.1 HTH_Tnp_Tc3_2 domain-containing protein [Trichonephila clavipes]GFY32056.1 HTH_Tnp_Tc3_2 domain-containing protein [Trichonephila clavipes]
MSQRRRLPNSLRWRAVGWMEMGLSQADAARRLNVSRSVVQRLWDQYQSQDFVSGRPVPGRPRATTPAEDRFLALAARRRRTTTVPQLVSDNFQASGRRISATTVRNRLHNAGLYARRPVLCVPLNGRQRRMIVMIVNFNGARANFGQAAPNTCEKNVIYFKNIYV